MAVRHLVDPVADPVPDEWRAAREAARRPFSAEEETALFAALFDPKPSQAKPVMFILAGPPGSGKSSCRDAAFATEGVRAADVVVVDGDFLRQYHHGWCALEQLHDEHGALIAFTDAQSLCSEACKALKEKLAERAVAERKHVMLTTVKRQHRDYLYKLAANSGYTLHLVVIASSVAHVVERTQHRADTDGRCVPQQSATTVEATLLRLLDLLPVVNGTVSVLNNDGALGQPTLVLKRPAPGIDAAELLDVCRACCGLKL